MSKSGVVKSRKILMAVAVIIIVTIAVGAYYLALRQPTPEPEQVLTIGTSSALSILDPGMNWEHLGLYVSLFICEGLMQQYPTEIPHVTELKPHLATGYEYSDDGKALTFTLREDVNFSDGTPFNASCVKYCWERALGIGGPNAYYLGNVDEVNVLDTYTVQIKLKEIDYTWVEHVGIFLGTAIYSPSAVEAAGDDWGKTVYVGSGPFKFESWTSGEQLVLVKNEDYWNASGVPKLDRIVFRWFSSSATMRLALGKGEIDFAFWTLDPPDIAALEQNPDVVVEKVPTGYMRWLSFNVERTPLDDVRVRNAISYAVDYDYLIDVAMVGGGKRIYSIIPMYMPDYYIPVLKDHQRNVTKAKELLEEAGYPDGFTTSITFCPRYFGDLDNAVMAALKDQLEDVGITLEINQVDSAMWNEVVMKTGDYDIAYEAWSPDFKDPDNAIFSFMASKSIGGLYVTHYNKSQIDELLLRGKQTTDFDERRYIYYEIQRIFAEDLPHLPIFSGYRTVAYRTYLKNWQLLEFYFGEGMLFARCYIEK